MGHALLRSYTRRNFHIAVVVLKNHGLQASHGDIVVANKESGGRKSSPFDSAHQIQRIEISTQLVIYPRKILSSLNNMDCACWYSV